MQTPIAVKQGKRVRVQGMNQEWLYHEYITLDKTVREVATSIEATTGSIMWWLKKYGIKKPKTWIRERHSKRMTAEGNPAWSGGVDCKYQARLLWRSDKPRYCIWCGTTDYLQVHHMDHNRTNGDINNLEWLCGPCNRMEAQMHALECAGRATVLRDNNRISITFTEV